MVISAPSWLGNENLWVVAMGILAFIGAVIGARAAWRASHPRLRLHIASRPARTVFNTYYEWNGISVAHEGRQLRQQPYWTTIDVTNPGNKDVPIDNDSVLCLELRSEVVALGGVCVTPNSGRAVPEVTPYGRALKVGPGFIPSRHTITIAVLFDGYSAPGVSIRSGLPNTEILNKFSPKRWTWGRTGMLLFAATVFAAGSWVGSR
jgi:hypothetical protein